MIIIITITINTTAIPLLLLVNKYYCVPALCQILQNLLV